MLRSIAGVLAGRDPVTLSGDQVLLVSVASGEEVMTTIEAELVKQGVTNGAVVSLMHSTTVKNSSYARM